MRGIDFLLGRPVRLDELREALASALDVPNGAVEVVESIEPRTGTRPPILAHVLPSKGDFVAHVAHVALYMAPPHEVGLAELRRVTELLDTAALMPDPSPDPYHMILVRGEAPERRVALDADSLDERDEYRLATSE